MAVAAANPFMKRLVDRIETELGVANTTAIQYLQTLYRMNGSKAFKNMGWSKDTEAVEETLKDLAPSTKAVYYRVLASVLSLYKSYGKTATYWKKRGDEVQPPATDEKTEKQKDNWLSWADVVKVRDGLRSETNPLSIGARGRSLDDEDFTKLLEYLLVSLYTYIPPRRNKDYSEMRVVKKYRPSMSDEFNYYDREGRQFIFNTYKTAKRYGQQIEKVPDELVSVLELYLKFHPLRKLASYPLIVNSLGEELNPVNGITRVLNRVFGKNLGSSMLRHIYLSDKYGSSGKKSEMEEDAEKMAHSVGVQQGIYVKK
jgi:hypothetical protein